jgi:hypothetical protein
MKSEISVQITELAGNHPEGFDSYKFGAALESRVSEALEADYPESEISVRVTTQKNTSGYVGSPTISETDDIRHEDVALTVDTIMRTFGEQAMQSDDYYS